MTTTADTLIPEQLWQTIQPLLPTPPRRYGGRPRIDDRAARRRPWRLLPVRELGCGSPITCWWRLRDWQRAGVWRQLYRLLLEQLSRDSQLDWSRASLDSISVRAKRGLPDRAEPDRPRQARVQVPPAGRPRRDPLGGMTVSGQHARLGAAGGHGPDRPAWRRVQPAARPPPVHGGAVAGVAGWLPAAGGALRAARRRPARVRVPGLCADLPQVAEQAEGMKHA